MPLPAPLRVPSYPGRRAPVPGRSAGRLLPTSPQAGGIGMEFNKEKKN